jgi:hypothetical protein
MLSCSVRIKSHAATGYGVRTLIDFVQSDAA